MGVYIKGMKMPKNCETCEYQTKGACFASGVNKGIITIRRIDKDRPDWCPLVEVPVPHGDLIDRGILEQELRNGIKAGNLEEGYEHYANINSMDDCVECVRYADTVIEAEGE